MARDGREYLLMRYRSDIRRMTTALVFLALAAACHGRVFRIWGRARPGMSLDQLGAKELYRAKVRINNGSGNLTVYGWDGSFEDVLSDLRRASFADASDMKVMGDGVALGTVQDAKTVARMILLKMEGRSVLFHLLQSQNEFELSAKTPATHQLSELPAYPGSEPIFFLKNADTGTSVEISSTGSKPGTVAASLDNALEAAGWQSPFPGDASSLFKGSVCKVYLRQKEMCWVLATDRTDDPGALVLMMHKKL